MTPEHITLPPLVLDLTPPPQLEPVRVAVSQSEPVTQETFRKLGWSDSQAAELYQTHISLGSDQS